MISLTQSSEQPPGTATQIQDAGVGRDEFNDPVVVKAMLVEDAGRAVQLVFDGGVGIPGGKQVREKGSHHFTIGIQVIGQQKGVMSASTVDAAITDRGII